MSDFSDPKSYYDAVVTAAEVRQVNPEFDYPPDAYALAISILTEAEEEGKVFLEVSSRPGRSEATKDKKQFELALNSIRKIKPDATYQDLCDPRALVQMPCRVLKTTNSNGKTKWFLVYRDADNQNQGQGSFDPAAKLRAAMGMAVPPSWKGPVAPPPTPVPLNTVPRSSIKMPVLRSTGGPV